MNETVQDQVTIETTNRPLSTPPKFGPHDDNKKAVAAFVQASCSLDGVVLKDANNPHFNSTYATLAAVVGIVAPACHKNKLAITQPLIEREQQLFIATDLIHESGEVLSFRPFPVRVERQTAQGLGSAITYARRYSLMNLFGLSPADDDGNAASDSNQAPAPDLQQAARAGAAKHKAPRKITKKQLETLLLMVEQTETDTEKFCSWLQVESLACLPAGYFDTAKNALQKKIDQKAKESEQEQGNAD